MTGRSDDITELYRLLSREGNPKTRANIQETIRLLKNESGSVRSMRESLIKAHRSGDIENVKDIHEYIKNKWKYRNY